NLAMPVMCSAAGFQADRARLALGKKLEHALTPDRLAQHQLAAPVDSVQIENLLCDVHPDSCNLHSGPSRSSFRWSRYHRLALMKPLNTGWVHLIILPSASRRIPTHWRGENPVIPLFRVIL